MKKGFFKKLIVSLTVFIIPGLLTACGGGGGGTSAGGGAVAGAYISGTSATGAPIAGKVVAIDANGNTFSATTDALGAYTVNVAGGTAPFILMIVGTSGGKTINLTSVATTVGQTINITPLTDLIVSTAAGQPGGQTLVNLCIPTVQSGCKAALTAATKGTNLSSAVTAVTNMVAPLNTASTNPLNGSFAANGTGMDALLDQILVTPASGQGAMATVTLVAVPGQQLGTVTMPATPGGVPTTAVVTPPASAITAATAAATTLSDIRTCLASFSALYPANMTAAPTAAQVAPFFDATFSLKGPGIPPDPTGFINYLSTMPTATAGTNQGFAVPRFTITANGFSPFDFTPQSSGTLLTTTSPVSPGTAWVSINMGGTSNGGLANWKMVQGAAYPGCPSGWRDAGSGHIQMHMDARIQKNNYNGVTTYSRQLPLHVETKHAKAEGIGSIVVTGPGLSVYSGNQASPVGVATPVTLVTPPVPTPPAVQLSWLGIQGQFNVPNSFYGNNEAIQNCQDLAATSAPAGTPCYDETAVAPGAVYKWTAYDTATPANVLYAFPYQIHAVPLSMAFVQANDKDLFPQNITATPSGVTALNTAAGSYATGAALDGVITFHYTSSIVYGAQTNNCGIGVSDATNTIILQAEQNADGLPTQQTSCTFYTNGLDFGSLAKPSVPFGGTYSYMYVDNVVLGNHANSSQSY